jgi:hypothetical protein
VCCLLRNRPTGYRRRRRSALRSGHRHRTLGCRDSPR